MNNLSFLRDSAYKTQLFLCLLLASGITFAANRSSDIVNTKHNLSASSNNTVKGTTEDEVCIYCHTPHGASSELGEPLWNRSVSGQPYTKYQSASIDADPTYNTGPDGSSKLCLSCHDGTVAIGSVNVNNAGAGNGDPTLDDIAMAAPNGTMPIGEGTTTGFTRNLGTDLTNDHPVSFRYDDALADRDTEMHKPTEVAHLGVSQIGDRPLYPLDKDNKMQCTSCHDPHVAGVDQPTGTTLAPGVTDNIKFLRGKRFQMQNPTGGAYSETNDIVCLGCHDKKGSAWSQSVHANSGDASETYKEAAADLREFPRGIKVWQAGCLNCHDTHAVQGTRRLLREGVDGGVNGSGAKTGGKPAIEETCYQCHSNSTDSILTASGNSAPDIKSQFALTYKMPITAYDNNEEKHDIGKTADYPFSFPDNGAGANFIEAPESLGAGFGGVNLVNRHAECTDCHNPHRQIKNERYDDTGPGNQATHDHTPSNPLEHNAAPGALKGTFGVEITAWNTVPTAWSENSAGTAFGNLPTVSAIEIRCGVDNTDCDGNAPVTKEYQVCLKCHSNFAYEDTGGPNNTEGRGVDNGRPQFTGTQPAGTNQLDQYTNQGMEFQAPTTHMGETSGMTNSGAHSRYDTTTHYNHRAWHPVMAKTNRTLTTRGISGGDPWLAPWKGNVGNQTMMCSDCHNNGTTSGTDGAPAPGGPHGSNNPKILRGTWTNSSWGGTSICVDCHNASEYTSSGGDSGFKHKHEQENRCQMCHISIPHGWKNKSFLANLNDIGPEARCRTEDQNNRTGGDDGDGDPVSRNVYTPSGSDTEGAKCVLGEPFPKGSSIRWSEQYSGYTNPPYYNGAVLMIRTFRRAGTSNWSEGSCGKLWNEGPNTPNSGKDFMDICP